MTFSELSIEFKVFLDRPTNVIVAIQGTKNYKNV